MKSEGVQTWHYFSTNFEQSNPTQESAFSSWFEKPILSSKMSFGKRCFWTPRFLDPNPYVNPRYDKMKCLWLALPPTISHKSQLKKVLLVIWETKHQTWVEKQSPFPTRSSRGCFGTPPPPPFFFFFLDLNLNINPYSCDYQYKFGEH